MYRGGGVSLFLPFAIYSRYLTQSGFYINLPLGGLAAVFLIFSKLPDQVPKEKFSFVIRTVWPKLDFIGFALFAPVSIMCLLALQYGGVEFPWNSATVIGLFCGSGGMLIVFLFWEWRMGEDAMIPFSMVSQRIIWCSCLVMLCLMSVMFTTSYYLPIYFQVVKGESPLMSGVDLFPSVLLQLVFAVISGDLSKYSASPCLNEFI